MSTCSSSTTPLAALTLPQAFELHSGTDARAARIERVHHGRTAGGSADGEASEAAIIERLERVRILLACTPRVRILLARTPRRAQPRVGFASLSCEWRDVTRVAGRVSTDSTGATNRRHKHGERCTASSLRASHRLRLRRCAPRARMRKCCSRFTVLQ